MSDAFIKIDRITKRFGTVAAVDNVNLNIARGEFFSLLGGSGCGKTTLLRMIAGFEFPTEGEIYLDGHAMTGVPANRRPTNMVFQSYAIFPHLNVRDNIAYGLRREKLSRKDLNKRVDDALAMIKLAGFGSRKADQLSGGQRQRIALARALVKRPKVLLLDEPLGALDKKLRENMQIELREIQRNVGITFVFVTHDQEEALSLSDRIAVMAAGRVLQIATPRELYEAPNCREVADFIGTMNFVKARVVSVGDGRATVEAEGFGTVGARLPEEHGFVTQGAPVLLAVRPEKIAVYAASPNDGKPSTTGTVAASAYLGDRSHMHIHLKGRSETLAVFAQQVDRVLKAPFSNGQPVVLTWDEPDLVLLPAST